MSVALMCIVCAGMICPHIVNWSMLLGAILSWGFMWPMMAKKEGDWYPAGLDSHDFQGLFGYKVNRGVAAQHWRVLPGCASNMCVSRVCLKRVHGDLLPHSMRSVQCKLCVLTAAEVSEGCQPSRVLQWQPLRQGYVVSLAAFDCDAGS